MFDSLRHSHQRNSRAAHDGGAPRRLSARFGVSVSPDAARRARHEWRERDLERHARHAQKTRQHGVAGGVSLWGDWETR
eukprot:2376762-Prymnesium_polylepis.1